MADTGFTEAVAAAWQLGRGALLLDPAAFQELYRLPIAAELAGGVLAASALSEAIGQSVVLFLHRVPPARFLLSLLLTAAVFASGILLWAFVLWGVFRLLFGYHEAPGNLLVAVSLGHAPFVFGFLILIPWLGLIIRAFLQLWTLMAVTVALHVLELSLGQIIAGSLLGWFLVEIAYRLAGGPVRWINGVLQTALYDRSDPITIGSLREALIRTIRERKL